MSSITITRHNEDDGEDNARHLPGVISTHITLCGWVDVDVDESSMSANCPDCLRVVAFCKSLKIGKSTLAKVAARS
jgi:hypothetical protein